MSDHSLFVHVAALARDYSPYILAAVGMLLIKPLIMAKWYLVDRVVNEKVAECRGEIIECIEERTQSLKKEIIEHANSNRDRIEEAKEMNSREHQDILKQILALLKK